MLRGPVRVMEAGMVLMLFVEEVCMYVATHVRMHLLLQLHANIAHLNVMMNAVLHCSY